jgi:hypothetical protein
MPRLLALAATGLLVATLGGCFLLPTEREALGSSQGDPAPDTDSSAAEIGIAEVGDCWEATFQGLADWAHWEGDAPVDCEEDHQSVTYFVAQLEDAFGENSTDNDPMSDVLANSASTQCYDELVAQFEWDENFSTLNLYFFLPSPQQWDDGERWVRCDVAVMKLGSSVWDPEIADLPADLSDLVGDYIQNKEDYAPCFNVDEEEYGVGPYEAASATYADCSADPIWRPGPAAEYPAAGDDVFPGEGLIANFVTETCGAVRLEPEDTLFPYYPDELSWADGDRWVECWITNAPIGGGMV